MRVRRVIFMTILSVIMAVTQISPAMLAGAAEKDTPQQTVQEEQTAEDIPEDPQQEEVADEQQQDYAALRVTPKEGSNVYPVLIGYEYDKDHFNLVEWAEWIDPGKQDVAELYESYMLSADEEAAEEERAEAEKQLKEFMKSQIESSGEAAMLGDLDELPPGLYYVTGEGMEPEFAELTGEGDCEVELKEAESAENGDTSAENEEDTEKKDAQPAKTIPSVKAPKTAKAPAKRGGYGAAVTDRSNDVGVTSEGYEDSPYNIDRTVWAGTQLNARDAEKNVGGTLRLSKKDGLGISRNYTWMAEQYWDGKKPFRITNVEGDERLTFQFTTYNDFALEDKAEVVPYGALKIDNLDLDVLSFSKKNFYARGNKFVIGDGVTTSSNKQWRIYGGTEHNADLANVGRPDLDTNIVAASGHWDYIFGGGEGRTGRGTQVTIRGNADVTSLYGGGERKGSVGYNETLGGGIGTNVYIEGGNVGTVYAGNGADDKGININGGAHLDISGGTVGKAYGCTDITSSAFTRTTANFADSYIHGRSVTKISGGTVGSIGGDMSRNVDLGLKRQVRGATTLEVSSDQNFTYYDMFDSVTVKGDGTANSASVSSGSKPGISFTDAGYANYRGPDFEGYIGQMKALDGGRIVIDKGAAINRTKEADLVINANTNDTDFYLAHGWVGESSAARRALSTVAINGQTSGITAASSSTFSDTNDKCGLRIHGNVQGDYDDSSEYGTDTPGYSTLEVLGDPIYSDGTDYYYYIVADSSANGGAAFREPEGADYIVCYRYLDGGKIGWYLRERPEITADNVFVHTGDRERVKAHVELKTFAYEWNSSAADCHMMITAEKKEGSASEGQAEDISLSKAVLAGIRTDSRFRNITYDGRTPTSFDVTLDKKPFTDAAYYAMSVDFTYDDDRQGGKGDCAVSVYDFVNTTEESAEDYQDSIMTTYPYSSGAAGADKARLKVLLPYGLEAEKLSFYEDGGSFTMTKIKDNTTYEAYLDDSSIIEEGATDADEETANTSFGVTIGGADLSSAGELQSLTSVNSYDCIVYSYAAVSKKSISNVHPSVVERDPADGIEGHVGEGSPDGIKLGFELSGVKKDGKTVGSGNQETVNKGELRIMTVRPPRDRTIEGKKLWKEDRPEDRPDSVTLDLYRNGEKIDTTETSADDGWEYSFGSRPAYDADGEPYEYEVRERPVDDYITYYKKSAESIDTDAYTTYMKLNDYSYDYRGTMTIYYRKGGQLRKFASIAGRYLNGSSFTVPSADVYVGWNTTNGAGAYGFEFSEISLRDGDSSQSGEIAELPENVPVIEKNASEGDWPKTEHYAGEQTQNKIWHLNLDDLSLEPEDGYFYPTNVYNVAEIHGTKTWTGVPEDFELPESIDVTLLQNMREKETLTVRPVRADESDRIGTWEYRFEGYPKYDQNMIPYEYTVEEAKVPGFITHYNGLDIENEANIVFLEGTKTWDASIDPADIPDSITVDIYNETGRRVDTKQVSPDGSGNWRYRFAEEKVSTGIFSSGEEHEYTVKERTDGKFAGIRNVVPEETDSETGTVTPKQYNLHNVYNNMDISGEKTWKNIPADERPASIDVQLLQNGKVLRTEKVKPDENGKWLYTFKDVPKVDEDGMEYAYCVKEPNHDEADDFAATYGKCDTSHGVNINLTRYKNHTGSSNTTMDLYFVYNGNVYYISEDLSDLQTGEPRSIWLPTDQFWCSFNGGNTVRMTVTPAAEEKTVEQTTDGSDKIILDGQSSAEIFVSQAKLEEDDLTAEEYVKSIIEDEASDEWIDISHERFVGSIKRNIYSFNASGEGNGMYDVENEPNSKVISGVKVWDDEGHESQRPESITVNLMRNGKLFRSQEVTPDENGEWRYSFRVPEKDKDGNEYDYEIEEEYVPGYDTVVHQPIITDGVNVTVEEKGDDTQLGVIAYINGKWYRLDNSSNGSFYVPGNRFYIIGDGDACSVTVTKNYKKHRLIESSENLYIDSENSSQYYYDAGYETDVSENDLLNGALGYFGYSGEVRDLPYGIKTKIGDGNGSNYAMKGFYPNEEFDGNLPRYNVKNIYNAVNISGTKVWGDVPQSKRPESVNIILFRDEEPVDTRTVTAEDEWHYSFDPQPEKAADGHKYTYRIEEETLDNFKAQYKGPTGERGLIVTVKPGNWNSCCDYFCFLMDGIAWEGSFSADDKGGSFYVPAGSFYSYADYGSSDAKWTVRDATAEEKAAFDEKLEEGTQGDDVSSWGADYKDCSYYPARDSVYDPDSGQWHSTLVDYGDDFGAWCKTWVGAESYETEEITSANRTFKYDDEIGNNSHFYYFTANSFDQSLGKWDVKNIWSSMDITGKKVWSDEGMEASRPESVTVILKQNGKTVDSRKITADDNWEYDFPDRPIYDADGNPYQYAVTESPIKGYKASSWGPSGENGVWIKAGGQYSPYVYFRHEGKIYQANGANTGREDIYVPSGDFYMRNEEQEDVTVSIEDGTQSDKEGFEEMLASGNDYKGCQYSEYGTGSDIPDTVFGSPLPSGYDVTDAEGTEFTLRGEYGKHLVHMDTAQFDPSLGRFDIKNTVFEHITISGTKFWSGDASQTPSAITVMLLQNGKIIDAKNTSAAADWQYSFGKRPKYDENGKEYAYAVKEAPCNGYEAAYSFPDGENGFWLDFSDYEDPEFAIYYEYLGRLWVTNPDGSFEDVFIPASEFYIEKGDEVNGDTDTVYIRSASASDAAEYEPLFRQALSAESSSEQYFTQNDGSYELFHSSITVGSETYEGADVTLERYISRNTVEDYETIEWDSEPFKTDGPKWERIHFDADAFDHTIGKYDIRNDPEEPQDTVTISGRKDWEGDLLHLSDRPESITVVLYQNEEQFSAQEVTADSGWQYSFEVPARDENGIDYTYRVEEIVPENYTESYSSPSAEHGLIVTLNADESEVYFEYAGRVWHINEYVSTSHHSSDEPDIKKAYVPEGAFYIFGEYADRESYSVRSATALEEQRYKAHLNSMIVNEQDEYHNDSWTLSITRMAETSMAEYHPNAEIIELPGPEGSLIPDYQDAVLHYDSENYVSDLGRYDIRNTYTPDKSEVTLSGQKVWDDEGHESDRPDSVTVVLYQNGTEYAAEEVTAAENWQYTFTAPKKDENGERYIYRIKEVVQDRYKASYAGPASDHGLIVTMYSYEMEAIFEYEGSTWTISESAGKSSSGRNTVMAFIPSDEFYLYGEMEDGDYYSVRSATAQEEARYTAVLEEAMEADGYFEENNISAYRETEEGLSGWVDGLGSYTVTKELEDTEGVLPRLDSYTPVFHYDGKRFAADIGEYDVKNTFDETQSENTEISGKKIWDDEGLEEERPESITAVLYRDGKTYKMQTTSAQQNWEYTFTVPKTDGKGHTYVYSVGELNCGMYQMKTAKPTGENGLVIEIDSRYPESGVYFMFRGAVYSAAISRENASGLYIPSGEFWVETEMESGKEGNFYIRDAEVKDSAAWDAAYRRLQEGGNDDLYSKSYDTSAEFLEWWNDPSNSYNYVNIEIENAIEKIPAYDEWQKEHSYKEPRYHYTGAGVDPDIGRYDIKNVANSKKIEGEKFWEGDNRFNRPESITVTLYRNNVPYEKKTVTEGPDGRWTYSFDVPEKDPQGNDYDYAVREAKTDSYTPAYNIPDSKYGLILTLSSSSDGEESMIGFLYDGRAFIGYIEEQDTGKKIYVPSGEFYIGSYVESGSCAVEGIMVEAATAAQAAKLRPYFDEAVDNHDSLSTEDMGFANAAEVYYDIDSDPGEEPVTDFDAWAEKWLRNQGYDPAMLQEMYSPEFTFNTKIMVDNDDGIVGMHYPGGEADSSLGEYDIKNIYKEMRSDTDSLSVSCTAENNEGDEDREFEYTITLTDRTVPATGSIPYTGSKEGRVQFDKNGIGHFTLKAGETITFDELLTGMKYNITQKNETDAGYDLTSAGNTGKVEEGGSTATFRNVRRTYDLTLKEITEGGMGDKNQQFSYTVTINGNSDTYHLASGEEEVIEGIIWGSEVNIRQNSSEGYSVSYVYEDATHDGSEWNAESITQNNTVEFHNRLDSVSATGVGKTNKLLMLLLLLTFGAFAAVLTALRRRGDSAA